MPDDYLVKERSNDECGDLAKRARAWFGKSDAQYLDICECLMKGEVWTVYGVRRLVLRIRSDEEMGKDDAVTTFADGAIIDVLQEGDEGLALIGFAVAPADQCRGKHNAEGAAHSAMKGGHRHAPVKSPASYYSASSPPGLTGGPC